MTGPGDVLDRSVEGEEPEAVEEVETVEVAETVGVVEEGEEAKDDFQHIQDKSDEQKKRVDDLISYAKEFAGEAPYEQNRKDDKAVLHEIAYLYSLRFPEDGTLTKLCELVQNLSESDATSDRTYWKEGEAYSDAILQFEKYLDKLDKEEKNLNQKVKKTLMKTSPDGTRVWMTDDDISRNRTLFEQNLLFGIQANRIDEKRRMVSELKHSLEAQKNGKLVIPVGENAHFIDGRNLNLIVEDRGEHIAIQKVQHIVTGTKDRSEYPVFPHEPNTNDISQGALGDCYLLASLSNLARMYPEKIKESIKENPDGKSVTVRLFGKDENGKYQPTYVTLDKVSSSYGGLVANGAENSLWVTYFERALVISGLYSSVTVNRDFWTPVKSVPELTKKYEELRKKIDKKELTQDQIDAEAKKYPWIFDRKTEVKLEAPQEFSDAESLRRFEELRITIKDMSEEQIAAERELHPEFFTKKPYYELVEWPNYNSISGGNISIITEMLLGKEGKRLEVSTEDILSPEKDSKYITRDDILEPTRFIGYALQNWKEEHFEKNFDEHNQEVNVDLPEKELAFLGYTSALGLKDIQMNDPKFVSFYKSFQKFSEMISENLPEDRPITREAMAKAVRDTSVQCPDITIDNKEYNLLRKSCMSALKPLLRPKYNEAEERLFAQIRQGEKAGYLMGAGSKGKDERKTGVVESHAYSLISAYTDEKTGRKFVKLRNPWGIRENRVITFLSDDTNAVKTTFDEKGNRTYERVNEAHGFFEMELKDFIHDFDTVHFNRMITKENSVEAGNGKEHLFKDMSFFKNREAFKAFVYKNICAFEGGGADFYGKDIQKLRSEDFEKIFADTKVDDMIRKSPENMKSTKKALRSSYVSAYKEDFRELTSFFDLKINRFLSKSKGKSDEEIARDFKEMLENAAQEAEQIAGESPSEKGVISFLDTLKKMSETAKECLDHFNTSEKEEADRLRDAYDKLSKELTQMKAAGLGEKIEVIQKDENKLDIHEKPTHTYLTELYVNERGIRMAKFLKGNVESEMTFCNLCESIERFALEKEPVARPETVYRGPRETGILDYKCYRKYIKLVDDLCKTYAWTDNILDGSSSQYKDLKNALKETRHGMLRLNGRPYSELLTLFEGLNDKISAYEERCAGSPKDNWRRNARVNVTNMLKETVRMAKDAVADPTEEIKKEYAKKIVLLAAKRENRQLSQNQLEQMTERLNNNRTFQAKMDQENLFKLKYVSDANMEKNFDKLYPKKEMLQKILAPEKEEQAILM